MNWESFDGGAGDDGDGPGDGGAMRERVRTVRFSPTRLRAGYAVADVDAFLKRAEDALAGFGAPLTPEEVRGVQFAQTTLGRGYDQGEVDTFLDELEAHVNGGAR